MWILSLGPHSQVLFLQHQRLLGVIQCFQSHCAKLPLLLPASFITDLMLELFYLIPLTVKWHQKLAFTSTNSGLLNVNHNVHIKYFAINSFIKSFESFYWWRVLLESWLWWSQGRGHCLRKFTAVELLKQQKRTSNNPANSKVYLVCVTSPPQWGSK